MLLEHTIYQKRKADEQYLMHYGKKGMKWDPSKRKKTSNSRRDVKRLQRFCGKSRI